MDIKKVDKIFNQILISMVVAWLMCCLFYSHQKRVEPEHPCSLVDIIYHSPEEKTPTLEFECGKYFVEIKGQAAIIE